MIVIPSAHTRFEQRQDLVAHALVEIARRLVGKENARPLHDGACDQRRAAAALRRARWADGRPLSSRPDVCERLGTLVRRCALSRPRGSSAMSNVLRGGERGDQVEPLEHEPDLLRPDAPSSSAEADASSLPSSRREPVDGVSRAPSSCSSVDFPPPVGPWIVTNSPGMMSRSTPVSAFTMRPFCVYVRVTPRHA